MNSIFQNLLNGNLSDAKKGAKRFSLARLIAFAEDELLMSNKRAICSALFLKGQLPFADLCTAERSKAEGKA